MTAIANQSITNNSRIIGYDVARALAVIGMVIVNFKIAMGASNAGSEWLVWFVGLLEGRAAATFVILAGVGISLLSQRTRLTGNKDSMAKKRNSLLKRAIFLFIVGLAYVPIWPADILHFYGIYIAIGAFLLFTSEKRLWGLSIFFTVTFVILMFIYDYEKGWDWQNLTYTDFWTLPGMIRHLFFNGFHPVIPWTAFLLVGMWLGRQDMHNQVLRRKLLAVNIIIVITVEFISWFAIQTLSITALGIDEETVKSLFGTKPMPPMPLYLLSAGATAIVIIVLCVALTEKFRMASWIKPLVATGQLALTLYVAHVIIGMGFLEVLGALENQTLLFSMGSSFIFCTVSIIFSYFWRQRFSRGPLESIMRYIT